MKTYLIITLILSLLSTQTLFAKKDFPETPSNMDNKPVSLQHTGDLFGLKFVPGSKDITFEVVGSPAAQVSFSKKLKVDALLISDQSHSTLKVIKNKKGFYSIPNSPKSPIEIIIKDTESGKTESFKIDSKP